MGSSPPLKRTPLSEAHQRLGARMVEFGGWWMPVQYTSILQEHHAVRTGCGLFDISHMGEVRVSGRAAIPYLNRVLTNDAARLSVGQAHYSLLCNERGGVIDDLYVYRVAEAAFLLVINASHSDRVFSWLLGQRQEAGVQLENVSDKTAALALQGPGAAKRLERLVPGIAMPARNHLTKCTLENHEVFIARTGYTGEDGFELFLFNAAVLAVWRRLLEDGATPCGLGARDTLRLEMGYPLHGNDLSETVTPIEAGLGSFVALEKPEFIGREILQRQKQVGTEKRLVAFTMRERGAIPRPHYAITHGGDVVGEVSSGSLSPSLQIGIGMGFVKTEVSRVGEPLEIQIRGKDSPATIVKKPFYRATTLK